ncbi:MAG: hypothetical protein H6736_15995 [Alphaproteobacteria bacterium]|nr:hypothetical protein [Alphaproteobacteria bacterium]MCB9693314.1 hypothetical protein [Alphaproteobacteria bacterium]
MAWGLPLPVLVGVVGVGIPAVLAIVHARGGSVTPPLDARRVHDLARDHLDAAVEELTLATDGLTALLRLQDGTLAVAWAQEDQGAARSLEGASARPSPDGLLLVVGDPAFPTRPVPLEPDAREVWLARLGGDRGAR